MTRTRIFILGLSALALLSCGENVSSSPVVSSTSSSETVLPCSATNGDFDISINGKLKDQGKERQFNAIIKGAKLEVKNDYPMHTLGDLVNYRYCQVANIFGKISFDELEIKTTEGKGTLTYSYEGTDVGFAVSEGDLYVDFTHIDLSDIAAISTQKYRFLDAFSVFNNDDFDNLSALLSIPSLRVNDLLDLAAKNEDIGNAVTMEKYDATRYQVTFILTKESLAALIAIYGESIPQEQIKEQIENLLPALEGSSMRFLYNVKTQEIDGVTLDGVLGLPETAVPFGEKEVTISDVEVHLSGDVSWEKIPEFELPDLSDYVVYASPEVPTSSESGSEEA